MRGTLALSVAATLVAFLVPGTASQAQGGPPQGRYLQTCRDVRIDGNTLKANCQKVDGGWRNTSLDYRACGGQIINDNGNLRCVQGRYGQPGGPQYGYGLPPGEYRRSCQNMRMEGNKLIGYCRKRDGGWRNTSLNNVNQCKTQIVNDDGNLRCQK